MMKQRNNTILCCIIVIVAISMGCIEKQSGQPYHVLNVGTTLDVGYVDGTYEQYDSVIDVNKIYDESGYYTRKITFLDGSYQVYPSVVDETIQEGMLYYSMTLTFKDGATKHLDHSTETILEHRTYVFRWI